MRSKSLEDSPPTTASPAAAVINSHDKFGNCTAYYFDKIDRNPDLFPKLRPFHGIQAAALCEFKYEFQDFNGKVVREKGYASLSVGKVHGSSTTFNQAQGTKHGVNCALLVHVAERVLCITNGRESR